MQASSGHPSHRSHPSDFDRTAALSVSRATWLPELDGLRGIAALAVLAHHLMPPWFAGTTVANTGVGLFYALSGFLIYLLAIREYERTGRIAIKRSFVRRILRIWPLYFAFICACIALFPVDRITTTDYLARYGYVYPLFLTNIAWSFNYIGGWFWPPIPYILVTWSITIEEQFYVVFPLLFMLSLRAPRMRLALILTLIGGAMIARWVFTSLPVYPPSPEMVAVRPELTMFQRPADGRIGNLGGLYYASFSYVDIFVLGAIAGHLYHARGRYGESPWLMGALLLGSLAALGFLMSLWATRLWSPYSAISVAIYTLLPMPLAGIIYASVSAHTAPWSAFLRWYPLRVLGFLSYAMYLLHLPLGHFVERWHAGISPTLQVAPVVGQAILLLYLVAVTILVSALAHAVMERPFLLLKRGRSVSASAGLSSTSVPWHWCVLVTLGVLAVMDTVYWPVFKPFG